MKYFYSFISLKSFKKSFRNKKKPDELHVEESDGQFS